MPKKIKLLVALCIVFNLLLVVGIVNFLQIPEVIRCEILTAKYGHEFENAEVKYIETIGEIDYIKVLEYTPNRARVYYVSRDKYEGNVAKFSKINGKWQSELNLPNVMWLRDGRAANIVQPYWWHCIFISGSFNPLEWLFILLEWD